MSYLAAQRPALQDLESDGSMHSTWNPTSSVVCWEAMDRPIFGGLLLLFQPNLHDLSLLWPSSLMSLLGPCLQLVLTPKGCSFGWLEASSTGQLIPSLRRAAAEGPFPTRAVSPCRVKALHTSSHLSFGEKTYWKGWNVPIKQPCLQRKGVYAHILNSFTKQKNSEEYLSLAEFTTYFHRSILMK